MTDLFSDAGRLERLPLNNADVFYQGHFDYGIDPEVIFHDLLAETAWRQESISVWGKSYRQPRLVAWYGDQGKSYSYSGIKLEPAPWTKLLRFIRERVEGVANHNFNSVLLNQYRDNNDSMGLHSDDEKELGPQPVIASLSLGAERPLIFKSKINKSEQPFKVLLESGSLLLMRGSTQQNFKHGILKSTKQLGPRINLTFRKIVV